MPEGGRIEPWVTELAERIGCMCRGSGEVARLIQEGVDERRAERRTGKSRRTWVTPYVDAYAEVMGGDRPDVKRLLGPCATVEEKMVRADDGEARGDAARTRALSSFRNFCWAYRGRREYINWNTWADNAFYWLEQTRASRIPM